MLMTVLLVILILALGAGASDRLRLRQEQMILERLPPEDARSYFDVLHRRARKVQLLRGLAILSLVSVMYAYKHHVAESSARPPATVR